MMENMQNVNKVMEQVNGQMDVKNINTMIREFAKNSEKFNLQQELMGDAMDMAFDTAEGDQEADNVYNQICEEQGIAMEQEGLGGQVGTGAVGAAGVQNKEDNKMKDQEMDDLEKRLDNLK